jgi:GT2 family glycosyltransferase
MPSYKGYVLIVNFNSANDTILCVDSLLAMEFQDFAIVVVDNGSTDHSLDVLNLELGKKKDFEFHSSIRPKYQIIRKITLINAANNGGFAFGNNVFLKNYLINHEQFIWLLNPDTQVHPLCLGNLYSQFITLDKSIVGCTIYNYQYRDVLISYGLNTINKFTATVNEIIKESDISKADYVHGGAMMFKFDDLNTVGWFDESYFLYWEETDWCQRAKQKGYKLSVCKEAIIYDKVGGVIGRGYWADYFYTRNGLRFIYKYYSFYLVSALLVAILRVGLKYIKNDSLRAKGVLDGILDFVLNKSKKP